MAGNPAPRQQGAGDVARSAQADHRAGQRWRQPQHADQHDAAARQEHEQPAIAARDQRRPGQKTAVAEDGAGLPQQWRQAQRIGPQTLGRLGQTPNDKCQGQRAGHGHRANRGAPSGQRHQRATQWWADDGDHAQSAQRPGHHLPALRWRVQVAHHGPAADHSGRHCRTLHAAPDHHLVDLRGQRHADAGQQVQGQADEQHRPPAKAVRQGSDRQLRQAERQDQRRHRHLHRRQRHAQIGGQRRQRGQHQVGGDRLQAQQQQQGDDGGDGAEAARARRHLGGVCRQGPFSGHQNRSSGRR